MLQIFQRNVVTTFKEGENFTCHYKRLQTTRAGSIADIFANRIGRILLVRNSYGKLDWDLPGGQSQPRETLADTATREVLDKTGLVTDADCLSGVYYDAQTEFHHFVFICHRTDPNAAPLRKCPEISACDFFPADALQVTEPAAVEEYFTEITARFAKNK